MTRRLSDLIIASGLTNPNDFHSIPHTHPSSTNAFHIDYSNVSGPIPVNDAGTIATPHTYTNIVMTFTVGGDAYRIIRSVTGAFSASIVDPTTHEGASVTVDAASMTDHGGTIDINFTITVTGQYYDIPTPMPGGSSSRVGTWPSGPPPNPEIARDILWTVTMPSGSSPSGYVDIPLVIQYIPDLGGFNSTVYLQNAGGGDANWLARMATRQYIADNSLYTFELWTGASRTGSMVASVSGTASPTMTTTQSAPFSNESYYLSAKLTAGGSYIHNTTALTFVDGRSPW